MIKPTLVFLFGIVLFLTSTQASAQSGKTPKVRRHSEIHSSRLLDKNVRVELFEGKLTVSSQVILRTRVEIDGSALSSIWGSLSITISRTMKGGRLHVVRSSKLSTSELLAELSRHSLVESVEPDYVAQLNRVPNDYLFSSQWGLSNVGQVVNEHAGNLGSDIKAVPAWSITVGSPQIAVGVIDSGTQLNHPDLVPNLWTAPSAFSIDIGGISVDCPAGSRGVNVVASSCFPFDDNGHGTHVAGIIGAKGDNTTGVSGVNWSTNIISIKAFDSEGNGLLSDVIFAINVATQLKEIFGSSANIRILNNSYSVPGSQFLLDEIQRAADYDILFVASAGNGGNDNVGDDIDINPIYPASFPLANIVSVASSDSRDILSSFSNFGVQSVDLVAPGEDIFSTGAGSLYEFQSGTSMAAPFVSGAAALILSRCSMNTGALRSLILSSVDNISSLAERVATGGRLNVFSALRRCGPDTIPLSYSMTAVSPILNTQNWHSASFVDINNVGQIVGRTNVPGQFQSFCGYWSSSSGWRLLEDPPNPSRTWGCSWLNDSGTIVGGNTAIWGSEFLFSPGAGFTVWPDPIYILGGLNDLGQVVGTSQDVNGQTSALFRSSGGQLQVIDRPLQLESRTSATGINNKPEILVTQQDPFPAVRGFVLSFGSDGGGYRELIPPAGYFDVWPRLINDSSRVAGTTQIVGGGRLQMFVADRPDELRLVSPSTVNTTPRSMNSSGQIVGMQGSVPFIYDDSFGIRSLLPMIANNPGCNGLEVHSINDLGQIVGTAQCGTSYKAILLSPSFATPEGQNVRILSGLGSLVFNNVITSGHSLIQRIPVPDDVSLPGGYSLSSSNGLYDISTTAVVEGGRLVCLFAGEVSSVQAFNRLRLMHDSGSGFLDVTSTRNFGTRELCGNVTSFSTFLIAETLAPTSANVSISGVVSSADGVGVSGARVTITDSLGRLQTAISNPFGRFTVDGVESGSTIVVQVAHREYSFETMVLLVNDESDPIVLIANRAE